MSRSAVSNAARYQSNRYLFRGDCTDKMLLFGDSGGCSGWWSTFAAPAAPVHPSNGAYAMQTMRNAACGRHRAVCDRCRCCELAQKPAREEDRTLLISLFVNTNRGPCTLIVFGKLEGKVGDRRKRVRRDTLASTRALFLLLIPDRLMQTRRSERRSFLAIVTDNYLR